MTPSEASAALSAGELVLVDVRESGEVAQARIPGAIHIPLGQLPGRVAELDRDGPVAFVGRSGGRSAKAASVAAKSGLDAINVSGGITAWQQAGLKVKTGR